MLSILFIYAALPVSAQLDISSNALQQGFSDQNTNEFEYEQKIDTDNTSSFEGLAVDVIQVDAGDVTGLIDSIDVANGIRNSVIIEISGTYTLNPDTDDRIPFSHDGNTGLPTIMNDITITGNEAVIQRDPGLECELDGTASEEKFRILHVHEFGNLTLDGVEIANGCADGDEDIQNSGAGILSVGTLDIDDAKFSQNQAFGKGGAGFFPGDMFSERLNLTGAEFEGNTAVGPGGALYFTSPERWDELDLSGALFHNNSSDSSGGAVAFPGDMFIGKLNMSGTEFDGNTAAGPGGAVYYPAPENWDEMDLSNALFSDNSSSDRGGAVFFPGDMFSEPVIFTGTKFDGNMADGAGGALYIAEPENEVNVAGGELDMSGVLFSDNSSGAGGGAVAFPGDMFGERFNLSDTEFEGNSATGVGGALYFSQVEEWDELDLSGALFHDNSSQSSGGAVAFPGDMFIGKLNMSGTEFDGNTAAGPGGAVFYPDNIEVIDELDLSHSLFRDNSSSDRGGAVFFPGDMFSEPVIFAGAEFDGNMADGAGGALYISEPEGGVDVAGGELDMSGVIFSDNSSGAGGGAVAFPGDMFGERFNLSDTEFEGNSATGAGGALYFSQVEEWDELDLSGALFHDNSSQSSGGAVAFPGDMFIGQLNLSGSEFEGNTAAGSGGAVAFPGDMFGERLNLSVAEFDGNTATGPGGAVYFSSGNEWDELDLTNALFHDNSSSDRGGAVFFPGDMFSEPVLFAGAEFDGNMADGAGGALYISEPEAAVDVAGGELDMSGVIFSDNSSGAGGGAVAFPGDMFGERFNLSDTELEGNAAAGPGGAVYFSQLENWDELDMSGALFHDNSSQNSGGAVAFPGDMFIGQLNLSGSEFEGNTAAGSGGAVAFPGDMFGERLNLSAAEFDGNTASGQGGAVYFSSGNEWDELDLSNALFQDNSSSDRGGAVFFPGDMFSEPVIFAGAEFDGNMADGAGGALYIAEPAAAVDVAGGELDMSGVIFSDNSSGAGGGAVAFPGDMFGERLNLSDTEFEGNAAAGPGGAVYHPHLAEWDELYLRNALFRDNSSSDRGGALFFPGDMFSESVIFAGAEFDGNMADGAGGALYFAEPETGVDVAGGNLDMGGAKLRNNSSGDRGGGVFFPGDMFSGQLSFSGVNIEDNMAAGSGGGLFFQSSANTEVELEDVNFSRNHAGQSGGGLTFGGAAAGITNERGSNVDQTSDENGELTIRNSHFEENSADGEGGAIVNFSSLTVESSSFSGNTAPVGNDIGNTGSVELVDTEAEVEEIPSEVSATIDGEDTPVVTVNTPVTIALQAIGADGQPLADELISVDEIDDGGNNLEVDGLQEEDTTTTATDGSALFEQVSFTGLAGTEISISFSIEDGTETTLIVTIATGQAAMLEIVTQPEDTNKGDPVAGPPQVHVGDAAGNSVENIDVSAELDENDTDLQGQTSVSSNEEGLATFDNLIIEDSGSYSLVFAIDSDDANVAESVEISSEIFELLPNLPEQVVLVSPEDAEIVDPESAVFVWEEPEPEVNSYGFELAEDNNFNELVIDSTVTDTEILLEGLQDESVYWWRVRAANQAGWGPYSEVRSVELMATSTESVAELPEKFSLEQNYPNPFNPVTVIGYQLPVSSDVRLEVYDMLGRKVATLVNDRVEAGVHEVTFDASDLSSGVYIYRLAAGDEVFTKKLTLIK